MTTIHTKQLTTIYTTHLKIQPVQKVNNTKVRKYCIQFPVFFPTHTVLTLSPQPYTSHHFTAHINILQRRLDEPHGRSGWVRKISHPPGFDTGSSKKAYPDVINIISGQLYVCHMHESRKAEGMAL